MQFSRGYPEFSMYELICINNRFLKGFLRPGAADDQVLQTSHQLYVSQGFLLNLVVMNQKVLWQHWYQQCFSRVTEDTMQLFSQMESDTSWLRNWSWFVKPVKCLLINQILPSLPYCFLYKVPPCALFYISLLKMNKFLSFSQTINNSLVLFKI